MAKVNGAVIWEGESLLDGQPVVAIVTGLAAGSANAKTGGLLQTWILRQDVHPVEARRTGADASICGECRHRSLRAGGQGTCYVNVGFAPAGIWKGYRRGIYPRRDPRGLAAGRAVRLGAYGDPGAVPVEVWRELVVGATGWTGYTHQWRQVPALAPMCMASVDTPAEAVEAAALGFRTFRIRTPEAPLRAREFVCPASAEAGHRLKCESCLACNGAPRGNRPASPVIIAHGTAARRFKG